MNEVEMMLKVFEKSLLFKCRYLYCRCRSSCRLSSTTTRYFEMCGKLSNPKTFIVKSLELLLWLTQYLSFHPLGDFSIADKFHMVVLICTKVSVELSGDSIVLQISKILELKSYLSNLAEILLCSVVGLVICSNIDQ